MPSSCPSAVPNGLNDQAKFTEAKISTFGKVAVAGVVTAVGCRSRLSSVTGWNAVSASSSNDKAVSATAIGGTVETTFSVEVSALAKAQVATSGCADQQHGRGSGFAQD